MPARVTAIYISPAATVLPHAVNEVEARTHRGLVGDRYFEGCGTFTDWEPKGPGRELTLIESEVLAELGLSATEARRNIVTEGLRLNDLVGKRFRIGDVLIAWENEALLAQKELGPDKFDIVAPSLSILAEPPVAVVDKVVDKRGTRAVAQAYLEYLYSDEGQDIAGKNFYRPISPKAQAKYAKQFPKLNLVTIDQAFGGWTKAAKDHFADGASFDQIYTKQ